MTVQRGRSYTQGSRAGRWGDSALPGRHRGTSDTRASESVAFLLVLSSAWRPPLSFLPALQSRDSALSRRGGNVLSVRAMSRDSRLGLTHYGSSAASPWTLPALKLVPVGPEPRPVSPTEPGRALSESRDSRPRCEPALGSSPSGDGAPPFRRHARHVWLFDSPAPSPASALDLSTVSLDRSEYLAASSALCKRDFAQRFSRASNLPSADSSMAPFPRNRKREPEALRKR